MDSIVGKFVETVLELSTICPNLNGQMLCGRVPSGRARRPPLGTPGYTEQRARPNDLASEVQGHYRTRTLRDESRLCIATQCKSEHVFIKIDNS